MKKIKYFLSLSLAFISISSFAQEDTKAKAILDELSNKTKTYSTIKASFSYNLENKDAKINETQEGVLIIKKNKYKLEIAGQEIYCDGSKVSTFIKDANELQINEMPDPNSDDNINPSNIFTIYEKGFKYKFDSEKTENGKTIQVINLYPINTKTKNYHTVKLSIDKSHKQIVSIKIMGKDGNVYTYSVKSFTPNTEISDSTFSFNTNENSKVEIIDLRE